MNRLMVKIVGLVLVAAAPVALAQNAARDKAPPRALISIYRIAPGKQLDFLKWMAAREAVDKEAGMPQSQWYAHVDGDSWDYLVVGPDLTPEQNKKVGALLKKHGLTTDLKQSLEVRQFIASHTDTFVVGPVTAAGMVEEEAKE